MQADQKSSKKRPDRPSSSHRGAVTKKIYTGKPLASHTRAVTVKGGEPPAESSQDDQDLSEGSHESTDDEADLRDPLPKNSTSGARESHKAQKVLHEQRRASKPHSNLLAEAKRIWALARQKNIPTTERQKHVKELMDVIRGKVTDIVVKHDASRIVQTAVKYGGKTARDEVAAELRGKYLEMIQSKYSKFLVAKLLRHCPSYRQSILLEFQTHVIRLLLHREASAVMAEVFEQYANAYERSLLLRDFYGKEVLLFSQSGQDKERTKKGLRDVLAAEDPERRRRVLNALKENLVTIFNNPDKGAITHAIFHRALWEYLTAVNDISDEAERERLRREVFESCQDVLADLVHTKDGSRIAREFIARGNSKDRKQIIKALKPHVERMCVHDEAQLVLFTALDVIDDTKLTVKSLVTDISSYASSLSTTPQGRRSLFYLVVPRSPRHFTPAQIATLAETDTIRAQTSKKDPETRMQEIRKAASETLIAFIEEKGAELAREPGGSLVVLEIMLFADGDKTAAMEALLKPVAAPYPATDGVETHPVDSPHTSRMYKSLLQGGHFSHKTNTIERSALFSPSAFASVFARIVGRDVVMAMAQGNGSFIVAELCERLGQEGSEEEKKTVKAWFTPQVLGSIENTNGKGAAVLLSKVQQL